MLGSIYHWWLWGSDKDSMNTRDRVGSRKGMVPVAQRCCPAWLQRDSPATTCRVSCCQETLSAGSLDYARNGSLVAAHV